MNTVAITGRITSDLRTVYMKHGSYLQFDVGVPRDYTSSEKARDETDFIHCRAFYHTADFIASHFGKGQPIGLTGHWQTKTRLDENGNYVTDNYLLISNVSFFGTKAENERYMAAMSAEEKAIEEYNESANY